MTARNRQSPFAQWVSGKIAAKRRYSAIKR
jgi:hypothetical protein